MRTVAVTGLGAALPGGPDLTTWWAGVLAGHRAIAPIDRFDLAPFGPAHAAPVAEEALASLPKRNRKRMDRFCQLALVATADALDDAGLDLGAADRSRVGTYVGNMFGGWEITEPSLRRLATEGYTGVSPYVASAWFPTAPQGQMTIERDLHGFSKTVSTDTASALLAIGHAAHAIAEGRADVMICGGAEAPITPYTYTFCTTSGRLSPDGYRPFAADGGGFAVGEGAAMLVLEDLDAARARGAHVHAIVGGFATGHVRADARTTDRAAEVHAGIVDRALSAAGVRGADVAYAGLDAEGDAALDAHELRALARSLGAGRDDLVASTVKAATGHLLGAAPATEALGAVLALRDGRAPALDGTDPAAPLSLATGAGAAVRSGAALVDARGGDGTVAAAVLLPA
jgi:3-oxoacyl-[acyl-carrier-protein] synthase II